MDPDQKLLQDQGHSGKNGEISFVTKTLGAMSTSWEILLTFILKTVSKKYSWQGVLLGGQYLPIGVFVLGRTGKKSWELSVGTMCRNKVRGIFFSANWASVVTLMR